MLTRSATWRGSVLGGLEQVGERGVRAVEQPGDVDREHPLPLLERGVDGRPEQHHAGVVDEGVEPSELGDGAARSRRLACSCAADVGLDHERSVRA